MGLLTTFLRALQEQHCQSMGVSLNEFSIVTWVVLIFVEKQRWRCWKERLKRCGFVTSLICLSLCSFVFMFMAFSKESRENAKVWQNRGQQFRCLKAFLFLWKGLDIFNKQNILYLSLIYAIQSSCLIWRNSTWYMLDMLLPCIIHNDETFLPCR